VVYYIPRLHTNLVSLGQLTENGTKLSWMEINLWYM
jgi:hypothetical protein